MALPRLRNGGAEERLIRLEQTLQALKRQTNELEGRTRELLRRIQPTIQEARRILDDSRTQRRQRK